jgi:hypothetical protein
MTGATTSRRALLLTAASLALTLGLAGCDVDDWDSSQRFTEDFHHTYKLAAGGRLSLESFNGGVEIYGWDKNEVEINGTKYARRKELLDDIRIEIVPANDSVQIRTIRPLEYRRGGMGAKYRIHVPRKVRLERIETSNGSVRVEAVEGEGRLRSSNGAVRLLRYQGDVSVDTSNGPIELEDFIGGARLSTSNGPVRVKGVRGFLEATTSNGPIDAAVERLEANRPLRLKTSNGPVRLRVDDLNGNDVIAQTSNGSLTVRLPQSTNARVKASTSNGSVSSEIPLNGVTLQSKSRLEGMLGSGGPLMDLATSNSSITIARD